MFERILVPVDLTDRHRLALEAAVELAAPRGGEILLLHVIESIPGLPLREVKGFYRRLERTAALHLKKLTDLLHRKKVLHRQEIRIGQRAPDIVACAVESGSNLIILTAPPLEPGKSSGWGSVSYKVGLLARCPVLLVK